MPRRTPPRTAHPVVALAGALAVAACAATGFPATSTAAGSVDAGSIQGSIPGSSDSGSQGGISGSIATLGQAAGSLYGSSGPLESPLNQTLGSANGSVANPGPLAKVQVEGSCDRTTAAHPRPVVLVHGTYGNGRQMASTLGAELVARGYCTVSPTVGAYEFAPWRGGLASAAQVSGPQVAAVVDDVLARTGADKVDLVGLSQGAGIAGYVAKSLRPTKVASVVSVAGYWGSEPLTLLPSGIGVEDAGSLLGLANLDGLADLIPSSRVHASWYGPEGTPFARGISYTLLASRTDPVMPPDSSFPPAEAIAAGVRSGATVKTVVLQDGCSVDRADHDSILRDPRVHDLVANALDPAHPVAVRCRAFG